MGGIKMKVRLKNGEVLKIADYHRIVLDSCDSWGNPIEVDWKDIEQILDDDDLPLGMSKKINGMTLIPKSFDLDERRYDIALSVLQKVNGNPREMVNYALQVADILIDELKRKK